MPLKLFCEGELDSFDHKVLTKLIDPPLFTPAGTRIGLAERILFLRKESKINAYGLRDRDFAKSFAPPEDKLLLWESNQQQTNHHIGWTWERKEIENYLLDPQVVKNAIGARPFKNKHPLEGYEEKIAMAAQQIAAYTAARISLSVISDEPRPDRALRKPPSVFPNKDASIKLIKERVSPKAGHQKAALELFEQYLAECLPEGGRGKRFLYFFSGRDLLASMNLGGNFLAMVMDGLEHATEVWNWLPEWANARGTIGSVIQAST